MLGRGREGLIGVDLEGGLERGVGEAKVAVGRHEVCHGRRWWPSGTMLDDEDKIINELVSARALLRRASQRLTCPL